MANDYLRLFNTKNCAVCKKEFVVHSDYAYKRGKPHEKIRYYCSWKCLRASEEKPKRKKGRPKSEHAEEICEMLAQNYTTKQICEKLHVVPNTVKYWKIFGELNGTGGYHGGR